ncbi:MAG: ATP-grasp domain-containing protein [Gaiellales bacterium]
MAGNQRGGRRPVVAVIAWRRGWCNGEMVAAWREHGIPALLVKPTRAAARLEDGDVAVNRLDVLPTLDGVEPGADVVTGLADRGVRVLNRPGAMLLTHDKAATARVLEAVALPHPRTVLLEGDDEPQLDPPFVAKPRFGSWGEDVVRCLDRRDLPSVLSFVRSRPWFHSGAILQEYVPHRGDLRLVVAGGRVVGGVERRPASGEWRTNFSLGGSRHPAQLTRPAVELALAAAEAVGTDLVGVDLIRIPGEGHAILELNGAVDFDRAYSLPGGDAYLDAASALDLPGRVVADGRRIHGAPARSPAGVGRRED